MSYYQIITSKIAQTFTYFSQKKIAVGSLVKIDFNNKKTTGIIILKTDEPKYKTKEILQVIVEEALTPQQIELCIWMSKYYQCGINKCIQLFIPKVVDLNKQPKYKETIKLNIEFSRGLEATKRAKKQQALLQFIKNRDGKNYEEVKEQFSPTIIKQVLEKKLIGIEKGKLLNPIKLINYKKLNNNHKLTEDQNNAIKVIKNSRQSTNLIQGVTGSGKTEIYLRLIREQIEQEKQCMLLVPEIALTTQLINYFIEEFGEIIAVINSKLSDGERLQQWHRIHKQEAKLIMGSRSALFTPWKNLSLIIIDEEHEWTYKQESVPRYHTRTVSKKIIELNNKNIKYRISHEEIKKENRNSKLNTPHSKLILGSATPSIESYYKAKQDDYNLIELTERANKSKLAPVTLVDLRHEYEKKNYSMISDDLKEAIQTTLKKKEQAILFLNKRGMAASITCRECGYSPTCTNCDVTLTFHSAHQKQYLLCHYCSTVSNMITKCSKCQSVAIKQLGTGTQKAVQQIQELFPLSRIIRADQDTTSRKRDFEKLYNKMKNGEADIMIGTQMISKGLDLPNVTTVGVLLADIGLHFPSFRASEKVFQLLTQVAGRAGRHKTGRVIIQTYNPDHIAIKAAKNHDYLEFYDHEIKLREEFNYPPFADTIQLTFAHPDKKIAYEECIKLYETINQRDHRNLKKPITNYQLPITSYAPNVFPRLHNKYIWHIFLRGENIKETLSQFNLKDWKIDIDPN